MFGWGEAMRSGSAGADPRLRVRVIGGLLAALLLASCAPAPTTPGRSAADQPGAPAGSSGGTKTLRIYNLLAYDDLWQRVPVHEHVQFCVMRHAGECQVR